MLKIKQNMQKLHTSWSSKNANVTTRFSTPNYPYLGPKTIVYIQVLIKKRANKELRLFALAWARRSLASPDKGMIQSIMRVFVFTSLPGVPTPNNQRKNRTAGPALPYAATACV